MIVAILNVYLVLLFMLVQLQRSSASTCSGSSRRSSCCCCCCSGCSSRWAGARRRARAGGAECGFDRAEVAGEVIEVPVEANKPLKAGDVLFRIDPAPYQAQVKALEAQLKFQELRLAQMAQLQSTAPAAASTSSSARPRSISSRAQLDGAKWNLDKTVVRAPADGYVTNLALRKGARVANLPLSPVMAFIDTSATIIGVEIAQIDARYVATGPAGRADVQVHAGRGLCRQGRGRAAGDRDRPDAGVRRRCRAEDGSGRAIRGARQAQRGRIRGKPAGRQRRRRRDLHRSRQGRPM